MQKIHEARLERKWDMPAIEMERVEKQCRICTRSCNEYDPVCGNAKLKWGYSKTSYIDPETGLEVVSGKIDFVCDKVVP